VRTTVRYVATERRSHVNNSPRLSESFVRRITCLDHDDVNSPHNSTCRSQPSRSVWYDTVFTCCYLLSYFYTYSYYCIFRRISISGPCALITSPRHNETDISLRMKWSELQIWHILLVLIYTFVSFSVSRPVITPVNSMLSALTSLSLNRCSNIGEVRLQIWLHISKQHRTAILAPIILFFLENSYSTTGVARGCSGWRCTPKTIKKNLGLNNLGA